MKVTVKNKYKGNPRKITDNQLELLKEHLEELGDLSGVIYCANNKAYVGGNQRSTIFDGAEIEITEKFETPTKNKTIAHGFILYNDEKFAYREVSFTEEEFKKACIVANNDGGVFDFELLKSDWNANDLAEWGLDIPEFDGEEEELEAQEDDYEVPENGIETDIVLGDLFEIGLHRLLCGDSTDSDSVAKLMNGEKADMVFTDPPYGIAHSGKGIKGVANENDFGEILGDSDVSVAIDSFNLCVSLYPESTLIFWGANYYPNCLPNGFGWLFWDKEKEGNTFSGGEIAFVNKGVRFDVFRHRWHGMIKASEMGEKRLHPTQKPVALVEFCFNNYNAGNLILDPFLGSGSTMVASHQLKRKVYGMELDPKYVEVCVLRMIKLDNTLIIKRNGIDETKKWLDKIA